MERIAFKMDGEDAIVNFYVLEQTTIGGVNYILVTDAEEEEDGDEQVYCMVENEEELAAVAGVFENMLDDIDLIE